MPYHNILSKTETCFVAYLIGQSAGTAADVLPGKRSLKKQAPCTQVYGERWLPQSKYSGNYKVSLSLIVKANFNDAVEGFASPEAAHDDRLGKTYDAIYITDPTKNSNQDLVNALNAINTAATADYWVLNVEVKDGDAGQDADTGVWMETINLEVMCCPNRLA